MQTREPTWLGPGIGTYEEVAAILPDDYDSLLDRMETQRALNAAKRYIEDNLCKELDLTMVTVPLIVTEASGVNDMLDRDGSRTPIEFPCGLGLDQRIRAQVVQAATKWKRMALAQFGCPGRRGHRCARTTSSTTTTAPTSTSGTGSASSPTRSATSTS